MSVKTYATTLETQQRVPMVINISTEIQPTCWFVLCENTLPALKKVHKYSTYVIRQTFRSKNVMRVYRETPNGKLFLGYAPTISWAKRLCATEHNRVNLVV